MGDPAGPAGEAVAELREMAVSLRVLGSYPAAAAREDV
jgi:prephenate dehydratase